MDKREFDVNSYHMVVRLNTGPGPYLYQLPEGREARAESGDYLIYENDKIVGHLPARIIDAMALDVPELLTIERVKQVSDMREESVFYEVEVGPGERFDGTVVLDNDGKPVEEFGVEGAERQRIRRKLSTDDLDADGELKTKEDRENDARAKELLVSHPVNRFSSAQQRAAKEVAALEREEASNSDAIEEELKEGILSEEARQAHVDGTRKLANTRVDGSGRLGGLDKAPNDETEDERKNRLASQSYSDSQMTNEGTFTSEERSALRGNSGGSPFPGSLAGSSTPAPVQTKSPAPVVSEEERKRREERERERAAPSGSSALDALRNPVPPGKS